MAHHHFYHWLRGYYQSSRDYIDAWQRKEPARWEHLTDLFAITSEVEEEVEKKSGRSGARQEDLDTFLLEEMGDVEEET